MDIEDYGAQAKTTAIYPRVRLLIGDTDNVADAVEAPWLYPILGLVGETAELANQAKKIIRDDKGILTPERATKMRDELGDGAWYQPLVASALGASMSNILQANLAKLFSRKSRGVLGGSGDNR